MQNRIFNEKEEEEKKENLIGQPLKTTLVKFPQDNEDTNHKPQSNAVSKKTWQIEDFEINLKQTRVEIRKPEV